MGLVSSPCTSVPSLLRKLTSSVGGISSSAIRASFWCVIWRSTPFSHAKTSGGLLSPPPSSTEQPFDTLGLLTTAGGGISRSAAPPLRRTRAGYTDWSSATRKLMDAPSAVNRGALTPRSRSTTAFTSVGALLPSAATTARRSIPYALYFLSASPKIGRAARRGRGEIA